MHKWARFIKNIVGQWNYFEPPANTKRKKKKSYDDHLEKSCVYKIHSLILILFENHFYKQINKLTCFVLHIILLVIKISIPFGDQWLVIQVKRRKLKRTIQTFSPPLPHGLVGTHGSCHLLFIYVSSYGFCTFFNRIPLKVLLSYFP